MTRALEEGAKGLGRTAPNPAVGAVVVRDGVEIGAGWHRRAGCPHAEREAMARVAEVHGLGALRGATIYVTLEPCSTHGRTPPCTEGLIESGISRVVYGAVDPNPRHAGGADGILGKAGIEVCRGVLEAECGELIRGFVKVQQTGRPWVIWKSAMSLDARLTRPAGEGMWLTGEAARAEVQKLRAACEAIVTGGETVRRDKPRLDLREPSYLEGREIPLRVVISNRPESLPADAPLFCDAAAHRTRVLPWGDPGELLESLAREDGVNTVLLECGGRLAGAWMDAGCIDEIAVFLAPRLCGGPDVPLAGLGFPEGITLGNPRFRKIGPDVLLRAVVARQSGC
ncbi:MAG: bifunctional diaminohydroxyphosphoribosylaminopyrimidine deaminase/5-amino-6-(5-phosphoribosylamino)uracil reductase RibD [Akkermansiaceae bacterium]|jgi:diaminohydroxyphosphoribosylaminopyrimidine deaminase/5-amino-6-(5-phosphoribosylamino)uracil reductase|nr:bifunctional diaminohydroxyphosphoribosylaminopyrimidine deaminase/5-amino-6-(5-phosphoribosylamino)uracil reductase RibD [Akkermansiaceae bacterium]